MSHKLHSTYLSDAWKSKPVFADEHVAHTLVQVEDRVRHDETTFTVVGVLGVDIEVLPRPTRRKFWENVT